MTFIPYKRCTECGVVSCSSYYEGETCPFNRYGPEARKVCGGKLVIDDSRCQARIHHGPGHQSTTRCELEGDHEIHEAHIHNYRARWRGLDGSTDFFDEVEDLEE